MSWNNYLDYAGEAELAFVVNSDGSLSGLGDQPPFSFAPITWAVEGSLALQSVDEPCGLFTAPFPAGNIFFCARLNRGDVILSDFSGGDDASVVADIPSEPGTYMAGINIGANADYTITVNYSTTPKPRTYGFLVGLGLAGLFAMSRTRPKLS